MSKEMRRLIDTFKRFNLNESRKNLKLDILKDREELIDIFKWISYDDYNGENPNFQLQGTPNNIILHFQRFFGENQFEIKEWLISGVNYVMEVYGYKYGNSKPVSISYELDNPNYDELADLLHDEEGVIAGGKSPKNSNKKIIESKTFDKIEDVLGLKVNTLSIRISKVGG
jgi:hypothetical protein